MSDITRFSVNCSCPVCQGFPTSPRGKGERCWGYLSADGKYANCTREEFAGGLPVSPENGIYGHYMVGRCRCGTRHSSSAWPARSAEKNGAARPSQLKNPARSATAQVSKERVWNIPLADGRVVEHIRKDQPGGRKKYSWRLDGEYTLGGIRTTDLPLYAIDQLADSGTPVVVCEGEKAADALLARGIAAVGTVTGAAVIPNDASLRPLLGRRVILWPDNDDKGREHMRRIADRLQALGAPVGVTP